MTLKESFIQYYPVTEHEYVLELNLRANYDTHVGIIHVVV